MVQYCTVLSTVVLLYSTVLRPVAVAAAHKPRSAAAAAAVSRLTSFEFARFARCLFAMEIEQQVLVRQLTDFLDPENDPEMRQKMNVFSC